MLSYECSLSKIDIYKQKMYLTSTFLKINLKFETNKNILRYIPHSRFVMNKTKLHILKHSFMLFLKRGYQGVTMRELLARTQVSKGALYHYFDSKESLFKETLGHYFFKETATNFNAALQKNTLEAAINSYLQKKTEMTRRLEFDESTGLSSINFIMLIFEAIRHFPDFREQLQSYIQKEMNCLTEMIKIAKQRNELKENIDPKKTAKHIYYLMDGIELHSVLITNLLEVSNTQREQVLSYIQLIKK